MFTTATSWQLLHLWTTSRVGHFETTFCEDMRYQVGLYEKRSEIVAFVRDQ
jgi:hypothetical protein